MTHPMSLTKIPANQNKKRISEESNITIDKKLDGQTHLQNTLFYSRDDVKADIVCGVNIIDNKYDKKNKTLIADSVCHRFTGFNTYKQLFIQLQTKQDIDRCYFEVIKQNCKPYLDIEYTPADYPDIKPTIIDQIVTDIVNVFVTIYELPLDANDIVICDSHKYDGNSVIKYSWHVIVSPVNRTYVYQHNRFDNENTACDLVYHLCAINKAYIEIIDRSVYTKCREMRMFLCNKYPTENRILKWSSFDIKTIDFKTYARSLINYIDPQLELNSIETSHRSNPKTFFNTKKEVIQIEDKKRQFKKKIAENPIAKPILRAKPKCDNYAHIEEIVDNLADYRACEYEDWIRIKWALKNQSDIDKDNYFDIFDMFSKKSIKYDVDDVKTAWNNTVSNARGLTIGSLKSMLYKDNIEAYKYVSKKYNKHDPQAVIEQFYSPDVTKYFDNIIEYTDDRTRDFTIKDGHKGCFVDIEMGMGKTETLFKQLIEHNKHFLTKNIAHPANTHYKTFLAYETPYKKILVITHRRTIAGKFYGDLKKMNFKLYFDYKDQSTINVDRLIVQVDSLCKVALNRFDLILLDECESLFSHFKYEQMRSKDNNITALEHFIKTAPRVVLMDANMSIKSYEIMKHIDDLTKYTLIRNKHKKLKDWKMTFMNGDEQTTLIKADIAKNDKICVASLSKTQVDAHYAKIIPNHLFYSSSASNEEKFKGVMNVNETWKDKNIIYTPSISAGVSCTIENQFKNIYGYSTNMSALATDFIQMLRRIRHPINKNFSIFNKYINYYSSLLTIDDIERHIKYCHIIDDCNESLKDIPKYISDSQFVPIKNTAYYIHIYNVLEEEINRCFFKNVLVYLAVKKGVIIVATDNSNKRSNILENKINATKQQHKNSIIADISNARLITDEDYEDISAMMAREEDLTTEQQNGHMLKTLLRRFKYSPHRYKKLVKKDKISLIEFMMEPSNHTKFINNSVINGKNIDERITAIKQADTNRKQITDAHNYKQYHREHRLIHNMLKLIGFSSIKSDQKIKIDTIHANMETNKQTLLELVNEMNYINDNKMKHDVSVKTIGKIITDFYGYHFDKTNTMINGEIHNVYNLVSIIEWGKSYYPSLLEHKNSFEEYAF